MTKQLLIIVFVFTMSLTTLSQTKVKTGMANGLYLITKIDTNSAELSPLKWNEKEVFFSDMFSEFNEEEYLRIVVDTTEFVPLKLNSIPKTEQQTETKKKLLLSLTRLSSQKLNEFTTEHLMQQVVLIIGGEALTMHKIKEPITSGQLQISRCNDNACELLLVKLKADVTNE